MARTRRDAPEAPDPTVHSGNYREIGPRRCSVHGVSVTTDGEAPGWCTPGAGFPVAYTVPAIVTWPGGQDQRVLLARRTDCSFACPICREPLTWDGGCDECHGSKTPSDRTTWTFPGDRYGDYEETEDGQMLAGDGHHRFAERGPRPVATEAEALAAFAAIKQAVVAVEARGPRLAPAAAVTEADEPVPAWVTSPEGDA